MIRCDLVDADSGTYAATIEAPFIVADGTQTTSDFNEKIAEWFGEGGGGRLEIIARAKHHELLQFTRGIISANEASQEFPGGALSLTADTTTPERIKKAQTEMLYKMLYGRQSIRLNSLTTQALQDGEMPLFELPDELRKDGLTPTEISRLSGLRVDGLFQLEAVADALKQRADGTVVALDISRRMLIVTQSAPRTGGMLARMRRTTDTLTSRAYPLSALNNLDEFLADISRTERQA